MDFIRAAARYLGHSDVASSVNADGTNRQVQDLKTDEWLTDNQIAEIEHIAKQPQQSDYEQALEQRIDKVAQGRDYKNADRLAGYAATSNLTYGPEARAFVDWRSSVWEYAITEFAKVQAGQRTQPTVDEFIAELPAIVWPE